jgi:hypothetical protein
MLQKVAVLLTTVLLSHQAGLRAQQAPAAAPVPYDTFCSKTRMEKQELLKTMTAEQKTVLWQTQIERFRDANDARLNDDQRAVLKDFHAAIPEGVSPRPYPPATEAKLKAIEGRLAAAFSREELRAIDNYGPCIAKKVGD